MKNEMKIGLMAIATLTLLPVGAGWNLSFTEGWRVTAGAEFGGPMKGRLSSRAGNRGIYSAARSGLTEAQAAHKVAAPVAGGPRVDLGNGYFIDPSSAASAADPDFTWNWRLPSRDRIVKQSEFLESQTVERSYPVSGSDDGWSPAVSLEFTRELWTWDDHPFGVDFAFGFAWQRKNDLVKVGGVNCTRTDSYRKGGYEMDLGDQLWMQEPDEEVMFNGAYGLGEFGGDAYGPVMDLSLVRTTPTGGTAWDEKFAETTSMRGDYEEFDFRFLLKPWWDVTEWLRVYGAIGMELARTDFELHTYNSATGSRTGDISEWQVCGLGGGGVMVHGWHGVLGVDFLTRFLQDDLSFRHDGFSGEFDRSPWFFRVYVGAEF